MRRSWVAMLVVAVTVGLAAPATADWYDDFADGHYWYDSNYAFDPNNVSIPNPYPSPSYDPNDWDYTNPQWDFFPLYGSSFYANVEGPVGTDETWLRLQTQGYYFGLQFFAAGVTDGDSDPNTSTTYYDSTAPHYMLAKVANPERHSDPNLDTGYCRLMFHTNFSYWQTWWLHYEWYDDDPWHGGWFEITSISPPHEIRVQGKAVPGTGSQFDANDPYYNDPNNMWADPNYMDEPSGFWLLLQWKSYDANYPSDDPNGKGVWAACWNGDKYDWDGNYVLGADFTPNWVPAKQSSPGLWESGSLFFTEGDCSISIGSSTGENPLLEAVGAAYDDIEVRSGTFTNVAHLLDLTLINSQYGSVKALPAIPDPNDPNEAAHRILRYTDGTDVVLIAEPIAGKSFNRWVIFDPNYPGDANFGAIDSNTTLYLTMDQDYAVEAGFKCGSGLPPFLAMSLLALALGVVIRRLT